MNDSSRYIQHSTMVRKERLLPPGSVKALYRADKCGVAVGGTLSTFPDISGNGYDCSLVAGGTAPSIAIQPTNGVPVVVYSSANRAHTRATFFGGLTGVTVCALFWPSVNSVAGAVYLGNAAFTPPVGCLGNPLPYTMNSYYVAHVVSGPASPNIVSAEFLPPNLTWRIAVYSCTSSAVLCRTIFWQPSRGNIQTNNTYTTGLTTGIPGTSFTIGGRPDAAFNADCYLAEVFVLNDALWNFPNFDPLAYFKDQYPFLGG